MQTAAKPEKPFQGLFVFPKSSLLAILTVKAGERATPAFWAPVKGSDSSLQMFLAAESCQQSFCMETPWGEARKAAFKFYCN